MYWGPPEQALKAAAALISDLETSRYNVDEGRPELRAQLQAKIEKENGLHGVGPLVCCCSQPDRMQAHSTDVAFNLLLVVPEDLFRPLAHEYCSG